MLEYDMEMFEIYGKDRRTPNGNRFRNLLVQGYYDSFVEENRIMHSNVSYALKGTALADNQQLEIARTLLDEVTYPGGKRGGKGSRPVLLKPAGKTRDIMRLIPITEAPSQFFRRMIMSYCKKPFGKREQIVFKDCSGKPCTPFVAHPAKEKQF